MQPRLPDRPPERSSPAASPCRPPPRSPARRAPPRGPWPRAGPRPSRRGGRPPRKCPTGATRTRSRALAPRKARRAAARPRRRGKGPPTTAVEGRALFGWAAATRPPSQQNAEARNSKRCNVKRCRGCIETWKETVTSGQTLLRKQQSCQSKRRRRCPALQGKICIYCCGCCILRNLQDCAFRLRKDLATHPKWRQHDYYLRCSVLCDNTTSIH